MKTLEEQIKEYNARRNIELLYLSMERTEEGTEERHKASDMILDAEIEYIKKYDEWFYPSWLDYGKKNER